MVNQFYPLPLNVIQDERRTWSARNFPDQEPYQFILGAVEEIGELAHAFLKREQRIRGTDAEHGAAIEDALGDVIIYLLGFADSQGLELIQCVNKAWNEVRDRDWVKYPATGRPPGGEG